MSQTDWQFHPVIGQGKTHAAVGLARTDGRVPVTESQRELLGNLLDQTALELERARLEAEASATIALREGDRMRTALLASIGEDVKPRLLAIDLFRHKVTRGGGEEVRLMPKGFAVLAELARHAGRVLTHRHLLRAVWGPAHEEHVDYLRVAVRALRQKLEVDPAAPALIRNEPAAGYRLASE